MTTMVARFSSLPTPGAAAPTPGADTPTLDNTGSSGASATPGSSSLPVVNPTAASDVDELRYQMSSLLGRGGMGEVRLCHDRRIGRDVAIKLVLSGASDAGVRARFLREARVQGQLEHPAIVPVHDLEVFDDGSAYFAMKRVRGRTLADILAALGHGDEETARSFPLRKLLQAFNSVCLAVEFAHEKGVVHRDIKPSNIMLGNFGEVYLLDWGLAKVLAGDDGDSAIPLATPPAADGVVAGATVAGAVLGTPGYMAPEQIDASIAPVGPATDVYALGAVLFEILSLRRYLEFKDVIDATLQTLQGAEPRPSRRAAPEVAGTIAPALDELCARALARAPTARVLSARELHDEVERYLAGAHDLERRRAQATAHLETALAHPDTEVGRSAALRELGSAVAIDPDNTEARRALVRLLTAAPRVLPPAVRQRVQDDEAARLRELARTRGISSLALAPFVPIALWLGVREPLLFWLCAFGFVVAAPALNLVQSRTRTPKVWLEVLIHIVFLGSTIGFGRIAGPLMLVPGLVIASAVQLQLHPRPAHRIGAIVACCVALVLAFALEVSGLVDPSYSVTGEGILIHARMLELPAAATWFLGVASLITLMTPSIFAYRTRTELTGAEERLHVQAWQLAQIVPAEESRAMA
ncbi:MAG: serine/threonine protein kinase [Deltaproteobacteria bacterium]|nr:serine/threonine protein kinase [Deltaproteobacteria bacterium]